MKKQWEQWAAKFDALQHRERLMVLMAAMVVLWAVFDALVITPMQNRQKVFRTEIASRQEEIGQLQQQMQQLISASRVDPDAGSKQRLAVLKQKLVEKDAVLQVKQNELIAPERMPKVLESLLQRDRAVTLVSMTTLPVGSLVDAAPAIAADGKAAPAQTADVGIFKHGFEVRLEGGYLDLMRYVAALEQGPWQMLWGGMQLDATTYPRTGLTLTLYTLSLERAWLSI